MRRGYRYLSSLLLTTAVATHVAMAAAANPQDDSQPDTKTAHASGIGQNTTRSGISTDRLLELASQQSG